MWIAQVSNSSKTLRSFQLGRFVQVSYLYSRSAPPFFPFAPSLPTSCLPLWRTLPALQLNCACMKVPSTCSIRQSLQEEATEHMAMPSMVLVVWSCRWPGRPFPCFLLPVRSDDTYVVRKIVSLAFLCLFSLFPHLSASFVFASFSCSGTTETPHTQHTPDTRLAADKCVFPQPDSLARLSPWPSLFGLPGRGFPPLLSNDYKISHCWLSALCFAPYPVRRCCPPCPRHIGAAPGRRTVSLGPVQHCQSEPLSLIQSHQVSRLPAHPPRHLQAPPSCGSSSCTERTMYFCTPPPLQSCTPKAPYGKAPKCQW